MKPSRRGLHHNIDNTRLTLREKQVVSFIGHGLSNKAIAKQLNVSIHTVKNHVHNAIGKLQVFSRHELPAAAGALSPDLTRPVPQITKSSVNGQLVALSYTLRELQREVSNVLEWAKQIPMMQGDTSHVHERPGAQIQLPTEAGGTGA